MKQSTLIAVVAAGMQMITWAQEKQLNLTAGAKLDTSFCAAFDKLDAVVQEYTPDRSGNKRKGAYSNWGGPGEQHWIECQWPQPVFINASRVYWFDDAGGVRVPKAARLTYWNGTGFVAVPGVEVGVEKDKFNEMKFSELSTTRLRIEFDRNKGATGVLVWNVFDSGKTPNFPPVAKAGIERLVVVDAPTFLMGEARDDGKPAGSKVSVRWSKVKGAGKVTFGNETELKTTASFSETGLYTLKLTASDSKLAGESTLNVKVVERPPTTPLLPEVYTGPYTVTGKLWKDRLRVLVANWVPFVYNKLATPDLPEGSISSIEECAKKLAGKEFRVPPGPIFANTFVWNTMECMSLMQQINASGDEAMLAAQKEMLAKLNPLIDLSIAAQEKDGYLQTFVTLKKHIRWRDFWAHEGYQAAYYLEAAMANYWMTNGKDRRLYEAARRLADCFCNNLGPAPKQSYWDGHEGIEQSMSRFARFVDKVEGKGTGDAYRAFVKFTCDARGGGEEYAQAHLPWIKQYNAVGHAVRAIYGYSGMLDVAMDNNDLNYYSAFLSIWDNLINRKYYVTGGVGSGETTEGFGNDYSLPQNAYCESCSSCGLIMMQHKLSRLYRDAKYVDLYEETLYNALLGSIDLEGKAFYYTNGLNGGGKRHPWHVCPCCVGNIPRILFQLPTWMYSADAKNLYVNLFIGSAFKVPDIAGGVNVVQETEYPRDGKVKLTLTPAKPGLFALHVRVPNRQTSELYTAEPAVSGLSNVRVNGVAIKAQKVEKGYLVIERMWKAGDMLAFDLPMTVQKITADPRVKACVNLVALRCGPLVYTFESKEQDINKAIDASAPITATWDGELLGGTTVLEGKMANGKPFKAIPYYLRHNRGAHSQVWMRK